MSSISAFLEPHRLDCVFEEVEVILVFKLDKIQVSIEKSDNGRRQGWKLDLISFSRKWRSAQV